jgi:hypothetical protein
MVMSATTALIVMVVATTAARLTAAAPLTLHWKFTIVLVVHIPALRVAKGQPR